VNLSAPNLGRHPNFARATLREAVVGPGDVLYLPGWWWHQFEQPFEDTGALNLWSNEQLPGSRAPAPTWERDSRLLELSLHDQLESAATHLLGNRAGLVLAALVRGRKGKQRQSERGAKQPTDELSRTNGTLHTTADRWKQWVRSLATEHDRAFVERPASELVREFLELGYQDVVFGERWDGWKPGAQWDLSEVAQFDSDQLRARCRATPASMQATFASICDGDPRARRSTS
jgi:hypothetical protein